MKEEMSYYTKDYYIAAAIIASGFRLSKLIPLDGRIFNFVLDLTEEEAEFLIKRYWQNDLLVSAREYVDALHELKTRIHSERNHVT